MPPISPGASALQNRTPSLTLQPDIGFAGAAVRFHGRLCALAVAALWLGGFGGGRYVEY